MQITVTGKQIELSDGLHSRVWRELESLASRYRDREFLQAQVTFGRERRFFVCDINLQNNVAPLRSQGSAVDAYQAFKQAMEDIQHRLAEARSRRYHRRGESLADATFRSLMRPESAGESDDQE